MEDGVRRSGRAPKPTSICEEDVKPEIKETKPATTVPAKPPNKRNTTAACAALAAKRAKMKLAQPTGSVALKSKGAKAKESKPPVKSTNRRKTLPPRKATSFDTTLRFLDQADGMHLGDIISTESEGKNYYALLTRIAYDGFQHTVNVQWMLPHVNGGYIPGGEDSTTYPLDAWEYVQGGRKVKSGKPILIRA